MSVPVVVVELWDRAAGRYPTLRKNASGWSGARHFHVNSGDPDAVMGRVGSGLPDVGTAWSAQRPDVIATSIDAEFMGGIDDANSNGHHYVRVEYQSASMAGATTSPPVGASWCEIVSSTTQEPVQQTFSGTALPAGSGITRESNRCEIVVTSVRANMDAVRSFWAIQNRINSNSVALPPVRGLAGGVGLTAFAGELLARSVRALPVSDTKLHLQYTFAAAPLLPAELGGGSAFIPRYRKTDKDGLPVGNIILADVQGTAAYPAAGVLW